MPRVKAASGNEKPDLEFISRPTLMLVAHTFKGRNFLAGYESMSIRPENVNTIMAWAKQENLTIKGE